MTVRLGVNPLLWTNDDLPSLGAETPLEVCLRDTRDAGFSGIELGNKLPRQADVLGPTLDKFDLQLVSGWHSSNLLRRSVADEIESLQDHLDLLKALGSRVIVFCDTTDCIHGSRNVPLSRRPVLRDGEWKEYGRKLTQLGNSCLDQGMQIAYHHHMGTIVQSRDEIDSLMDNTGECVGLLLDTGHLDYAGGDALALLEAHGRRIRHVHCKNVRANVLRDARNRDLSFLDAVMNGVFTVPGDAEGCIDFGATLQGLKSVAYDGWLVVEAEQDPLTAPSRRFAMMAAEYMNELCAELALDIREPGAQSDLH